MRGRVPPFLSRRQFVASALTAPTCLMQASKPTLDIHVHLFGVGEGGTGCRMSKRITEGLQFQFLVQVLGLRAADRPLDAEFERMLADRVTHSGLARCAILAQDAVYDAKGKPDWNQTHFYVPNDYVFAVVGRHPERMTACPSINPNRGDAIEELHRCKEKGARLFKIHPPTQGVDVADRRHRQFFERCAELRMVVMVHSGHEHSAPVVDKHLASPKRLELALELGCTVVACHSGTGWPTDSPDQLPEFLSLLKRYPKLYGDTSVLGTAGRVRDFERLLDAPGVAERLVHGSDFPFPPAPTAFTHRIGAAANQLVQERNWIKQDFALKCALGIGRHSAERGYQLLFR
jgi:uncharacterized protein